MFRCFFQTIQGEDLLCGMTSKGLGSSQNRSPLHLASLLACNLQACQLKIAEAMAHCRSHLSEHGECERRQDKPLLGPKASACMYVCMLSGTKSGKEQAHKHKLSCPVGLGTSPGLSRGTNPVCVLEQTR